MRGERRPTRPGIQLRLPHGPADPEPGDRRVAPGFLGGQQRAGGTGRGHLRGHLRIVEPGERVGGAVHAVGAEGIRQVPERQRRPDDRHDVTGLEAGLLVVTTPAGAPRFASAVDDGVLTRGYADREQRRDRRFATFRRLGIRTSRGPECRADPRVEPGRGVAHEAGLALEPPLGADPRPGREHADRPVRIPNAEPDRALLGEDLAVVVAARLHPGPVPDAGHALERGDEGHFGRFDRSR